MGVMSTFTLTGTRSLDRSISLLLSGTLPFFPSSPLPLILSWQITECYKQLYLGIAGKMARFRYPQLCFTIVLSTCLHFCRVALVLGGSMNSVMENE